jgi:putative endonuclease
MQGAWVYIMANRPNGTLYVGVTTDLTRRVYQHRTGSGSSFTRKYGLTRLVYAEAHKGILAAIQREKHIKAWPRAWKVRLIEKANPDWHDLAFRQRRIRHHADEGLPRTPIRGRHPRLRTPRLNPSWPAHVLGLDPRIEPAVFATAARASGHLLLRGSLRPSALKFLQARANRHDRSVTC